MHNTRTIGRFGSVFVATKYLYIEDTCPRKNLVLTAIFRLFVLLSIFRPLPFALLRIRASALPRIASAFNLPPFALLRIRASALLPTLHIAPLTDPNAIY